MPWLLIALTAAAIVLPHPFNLTPIGALGLYAGATCPPRLAWLVPLAAFGGSVLVTGPYEPVVMAWVATGLLAGPLAGRLLLQGRRGVARVALGVLAGATGFFLLSNIGNWLAFFPHTAAGLLECYLRGLPAFGNTLLGDALYAGVLFGADAWLRQLRDPVAQSG
jgi:hypothetical protein